MNSGIGYGFTESKIGLDGTDYITFMIEPERLDGNGLLCGKAIHIDRDYKKQTTTIMSFCWVHGGPRNWEAIKTIKGEIVDKSELSKLLERLNIVIS